MALPYANLIDELGQLIAYDNAVLFIGTALRHELGEFSSLEQLATVLAGRIDFRDGDQTFTAIATEYERLLGRHSLIQAVLTELRANAELPASIHQLLARLMQQQPGTKVITTRFDHLLERALDQQRKRYMTIVGEHDVPYFDEARITLIKVRGDIDQPTSLVLTEKDSEEFLDRLPALSDVIRALLATKTLIFFGYDVESAVFRQFFRRVRPKATGHHRRAYLVVGKPLSDRDCGYWQDENVEICSQQLMGFLEDLVLSANKAAKQPLPQKEPLPLVTVPLPERPYKALQSFKAVDQQIFKGRGLETLRLVNRVLGHPHAVTVVYGESGSGKSSLLQAGVGPELRQRQCLFVYFVAERGRPLSTLLEQALLEAGEPLGLHPTGSSAVETLRNWSHEFEGPAVLAIDQFEQHLLAHSAEEGVEETRWLRSLLDDRSVDLRVVLALREDFLGRLQTIEGLIPGILDVRFRLEYLGREAAREAIEEPARLFGVTWESELVDILLDDLYEEGEGGVLPPQLQIVCDRLYDESVEQSTDGNKRITTALFHQMGGTIAILGDYLDREVVQFSVEEQPLVWVLLSEMVGSSQVKLRLTLDQLARAADLSPERAESILDQLTEQRLVQRYEVVKSRHHGARLEYELTHDYLVARIADRAGEGFWAKQKAWEIVRRALSEWQEWSILPAPDDLHLIEQHLSHARFSGPEAAMLYAAAVSHEEDPAPWAQQIAADDRRRVLLALMQRKDPFVRSQAANALAEFSDSDVGLALAQAAIDDPEPDVQAAAVESIASILGRPHGDGGRTAAAHLAAAALQPATEKPAQHALEAVWDLEPAVEGLVPPKLRPPIHRGVWKRRWLRSRYDILSSTIRGVQGGFWGLSLSLGPALGLVAQTGGKGLLTQLTLLLVVMSFAGVFGAAVGGLNALGWTVSRDLGSHERPWSTWAVLTVASALVMSLGFGLMAVLGLGGSNTQVLGIGLGIGLWIGLGLVGAATVPLPLPRRSALALTVLVGMLVFGIIGLLQGRAYRVGEILPLPDESEKYRTTLRVGHYKLPDGQGSAGRVAVSGQSRAGKTPPEIVIENAVLRFEFHTAITKLYFCALNTDVDYVVEINGESSAGISPDFSELAGLEMGGGKTTVGTCRENSHSIRVEMGPGASPNQTFAIGGRELRVDQVCLDGEAIPKDGCVEFDNLASSRLNGSRLPVFLAMGAISGLGFFFGLRRNPPRFSERRKSSSNSGR